MVGQTLQLELDHTVSISLQGRELDDRPAARLALRGLIYKAYAQHTGMALQRVRPEAVSAHDILLSDLSDSLDLDGRFQRAVSKLQQYEVRIPSC